MNEWLEDLLRRVILGSQRRVDGARFFPNRIYLGPSLAEPFREYIAGHKCFASLPAIQTLKDRVAEVLETRQSILGTFDGVVIVDDPDARQPLLIGPLLAVGEKT